MKRQTVKHLHRKIFAFLMLVWSICLIVLTVPAVAAPDPLPSWNDGAAKQAIIEFVQAATDTSNPQYVEPRDRIATFDNDGTMWVSHPVYTEFVFALDRLRALAPKHPEWQREMPFKKVLSGGIKAMAELSNEEWGHIYGATHSGMDIATFLKIAQEWLATNTHPRYHRLYTELAYLPMLEAMKYLRAHGFTTYIVTGGGQEFVRAYADRIYGVPPEQVVGSSIATKFEYQKGRAALLRLPQVFFIDDHAGKAIGINLFIGKRPYIAFGNSNGDREMLEWTTAGGGARLGLLVLHDDPKREYAYGPAGGLPDTTVGTFPQSLMAEAKKRGWVIISMKKDWQKIFAWE
ncbi:MAG: HAD family hydrolase [Syntrophobacterales bacterium]